MLEVGDAVVVDIGGTLDGYCSDETRNYVLGRPDPAYAELHEVLEQAQQAAVDHGPSGRDRRRRSTQPHATLLAEHGYGEQFLHRTGHGIGVEEHEAPWIVAGNDQELRPGMAFSIEPGIYVAGRHGARIEDIVVATDDGVDTLQPPAPGARGGGDVNGGTDVRTAAGPDRGDPAPGAALRRRGGAGLDRRRAVRRPDSRRAGSSGSPRTTTAPLGYAAGTLRPTGCVIGPVYTQPDARRRGVGEALLLAVQGWASGTRVPVVEISVAHDNTEGIAFLEALGYHPRRILMTLTPTAD